MASLPALRKEAKALGISAAALRKAKSADEVQALIAAKNGKPKKSTARKAVRKAASVKKAVKRTPAAKSSKGKAKRSATTTAKSNGKSGRHLIASVDFNETEGWNARAGSAPDRIVKALKKSKGNREKAFDILKPDVWDFVGKVKRNGDKRTKDEAHAMLKYRIARTLWDFARQTGQHKISTNRIEYGTGPNASKATQRKLAKRSTAKAAPAKKAPAKKRGRPKGSKNKKK